MADFKELKVNDRIIIEEIKFSMNINNNCYSIFVYAQDSTESDQYTVNVEAYTSKGTHIYTAYVDSCGNIARDEVEIWSSNVFSKIYEILFTKSDKIIRSF